MPEVPTFVSRESVDTGNGGFTAPASAFDRSGGLDELGRSVTNLSTTMAGITARQRAEELRLKDQEETVWVGEAVENERRHWLDWMADPNNAQDPQISGKFLDYSKNRVTELAQSAPSPRAAAHLRVNLGSSITRNYDQAIEMGRKSSLAKLGQSFDSRVSTAMMAYRSGGSESQLAESLHTLGSDIDKTIGPISQEAASKLKTQYAIDMMYAAIDTNPKFAEKLISASPHLDERQRTMLLNAATSATKHVDAETRLRFDQSREDTRTLAEVGKSFEPIPLAAYTSVYPEDVARAHKLQDDQYIGVMRGVSEEYTKIQDKHPIYQSERLGQLSKAIGGANDALLVKTLHARVSESAKLFERDRVSWMMTNNNDVRKLTERARAVSPAERPEVLAERASLMLRLQGPAPEDLAPDEAQRYLDVPEHTRSVLTAGEAEEYAKRVNEGNPTQALQIFDQLMAQFPNEQHRVVAFNDMVRLPDSGKGVRQELQLAVQNRGAWWLDSYVSAITAGGSVKQLSETETKEFEPHLNANPKWGAFSRAMIGDNLQRADEIAGFKRGILAFAQSNAMKGGAPKASVNQAIDLLLGSTLGLAEVNGRPLVVPRQSSDKKYSRTDDDIQDLGRRLSVALSFVDPLKVDDSMINLGDLPKDGTARAQMVRDQITSRGFFQPTQDGQGVSLFVPDDLGNPVQIRDRKGRAFKIMYDDLPTFIRPEMSQDYTNFGPSPRTRLLPALPQTTYDLIEKTGSDFMGTSQYRSHWPVQPNWMRNE